MQQAEIMHTLAPLSVLNLLNVTFRSGLNYQDFKFSRFPYFKISPLRYLATSLPRYFATSLPRYLATSLFINSKY